MIRFLFDKHRFSFFDATMISTFCISMAQGRYITAAVVIVVGPLVAVVVERAIAKKTKK